MSAANLHTRSSQALSVLAPLLLIGLTVLLGLGGTPAFESTITLILCNLIIVCGLQVFIGNSGVYSFGQLGFAAVGAYLAALLTLPASVTLLQTPALPEPIAGADLEPLVAILIAGLACGVLAAVVGLPLMRTSTLAIPISTFAFLIVVYNVLANWDPVTGGASGLVTIPRATTIEIAGAAAAAAVLVALLFKSSASGYRLLASRESEVAARSIGVLVIKERLLAFVLSAVLCAVGGALAVHESGVLSPATFYFSASVTTLAMLVVGGARSVLGAVIGTLAVGGIEELLRGLEGGGSLLGLSIGTAPGLGAIAVGLLLLVTMIARPEGLSGGREAGELLAASWPASPARVYQRTVAAPQQLRAAGSDRGDLRADSVSISFDALRVLDRVDLELARGEVLGLIGPNGAGKTTLLNVLSGFQRPDAGRVWLERTDLTALPPAALARRGIARTFQGVLPFAGLSGLEAIALGALGTGAHRGEAVRRARAILAQLELGDLACSPAGTLSAAEQRLLGIARALGTSPRFLLLDEPAAGLDPAQRDHLLAIIELIRSRFACGVLLVEHDLSLVAKACERVQVLDDGCTLALGSPTEIEADPRVAAAYLGSSYAIAAGA